MEDKEKLEWIYKGPNSLVDREDYLLGRKIDKPLEQLNESEKEKKFVLPTPKNHVEHECIPPSIRDFNKIVLAEQVDLSAKLQEDPLVAIKKREEEARRQFLQNPIQLKKLQEALQQKEGQKRKKHKKSMKQDGKLDRKILEKLQKLKGKSTGKSSRKDGKKAKEESLNVILMHKYNALKSKLVEDDIKDILAGKISDSESSGVETSDKGDERSCASPRSRGQSRNFKRQRSISRTQRGKKYDSESSDEGSPKKERKSRASPQSRSKFQSHTRQRGASRDKRRKKHDSESSNEEKQSAKKYYRNHARDQKRSRGSSDLKVEKEREKSRVPTKMDTEKQPKNSRSNDNDSDLDRKIMIQLKQLRSKVEMEQAPKMFFPEKPPHLNANDSDSSSDRDSESDKRKNSHYCDADQEKPATKNFGLTTSDGKALTLNRSDTSKSQSQNTTKAKAPEKPHYQRKNVKKMSEEEKERLRREMMQNATVRDKEREETVKRYRENQRKDETEALTKEYDADVIRTKLMKMAKNSSVEERIKSNLNNIQRSSRQMEQNFSKRLL